ncbi:MULTISPECIES: hypothetical protein [Burkholderia]|uniref:hypothetical protein n=1 Tax=Burkholderia TaxID=32008 RepID=UPI000A6DA32D|nr:MULTISPECIES: hypothetical protein [Burkholderia]
MNHQRKEFLRREMLGCAKWANACTRRGEHEEAAKWNAEAARRLSQLNGLRGNW